MDFLKLDSITQLNSLLKEHEIKEALPQFNQILSQNVKREKFDFDNFLSPDTIQKFRNENTDNSAMMIPMNKTKKIWKHDKIVLNYEVFKDVIHSTGGAK